MSLEEPEEGDLTWGEANVINIVFSFESFYSMEVTIYSALYIGFKISKGA